MATKRVLAERAATYEDKTSLRVSVESMGGVDAAARVRAGEKYDFVALASEAIAKLAAEGHVVAGTHRDIARSGIAMAVAAGARAPGISPQGAGRGAGVDPRAPGFSDRASRKPPRIP